MRVSLAFVFSFILIEIIPREKELKPVSMLFAHKISQQWKQEIYRVIALTILYFNKWID